MTPALKLMVGVRALRYKYMSPVFYIESSKVRKDVSLLGFLLVNFEDTDKNFGVLWGTRTNRVSQYCHSDPDGISSYTSEHKKCVFIPFLLDQYIAFSLLQSFL